MCRAGPQGGVTRKWLGLWEAGFVGTRCLCSQQEDVYLSNFLAWSSLG